MSDSPLAAAPLGPSAPRIGPRLALRTTAFVLLAAPLAAAALAAAGLCYLTWPATGANAPTAPKPAKLAAAHPRTAPFAPRPAAPPLISPASPFVLEATAADRAQAEHCLAQAVYYEAGNQGAAG